MLLFRHGGKTSSSSPPPGELTTVVVAVALRGEEYHVVAAVEGHELETPEAEHRLGLKRLLKTTHLELNGKVFVNTQQAPTWRANCRRFVPGGSLDRRVNLSLRAPAQMGLARDGTQGESATRIISHQGCACSRGYKRSRARERESEPVR
jgi:predicted deacylase